MQSRSASFVNAPSPRTKQNVSQNWRFQPEDVRSAEAKAFDDSKWRAVNLPHTWNAKDTLDETPGYRRGASWYRKALEIDGRLVGKRFYLYFEGANQIAEFFVNGSLVGRHTGGYTAFVFDITDFLQFSSTGSKNIVAVRVDNSINPEVPPSASADFNSYGGIYRKVWLIAADPVHLTLRDRASSGVYFDTPTATQESATIRARGAVSNDTDRPRRVRALNRIIDAAGKQVGVIESKIQIPPHQEATFTATSAPLERPHLWSPDDPYLYRVVTEVYDDERLADSVETALGIRSFSFDADKGFFLNGKPLKLRGANRHQDRQGMGNAVPDELQIEDVKIIKEMGANCLLLAHYPQSQAILDAADRLGLIVWEEIPVVREISVSEAFTQNSRAMLAEMIRQHYNHPSIVMWGYMNEILLKLHNEPGYTEKVVALAKSLDALARKEDSMRVTVMALNRNEIYNATGLADIPNVLAWHMYFGWYYGETNELGKFLDEQHRRYPQRKLFISEYGADDDERLHTLSPVKGDYTGEYALKFHADYVRQLATRDFVAGAGVWNEFDFGSESRGDAMPHVNKKGLMSFDRKPKDIYYFYKALWSDKPTLHIAARDWAERVGVQGASDMQPVEIFTNAPEVELYVNGESLGVKKNDSTRRIIWNVKFREGVNMIEARAGQGSDALTDKTEVRFTARPSKLANAPFESMAINVGSQAQFRDARGTIWEADQAYTTGNWGYTDGEAKRIAADILETSDDPLYQTYREGVKSYRFDLPDGVYECDVLFAEPELKQAGERIFTIEANGETVIKELDLAKETGARRAYRKLFRTQATKNQGVILDFKASKGLTIISAIRLKRVGW